MHAVAEVKEASGGPGVDPPVRNLYEAFMATVERIGDDPAIISEEEGVRTTWAEHAAKVRRIAGGLRSLGVGKGERLAILLGNRSEFFACDMAAVSIGAIPFSIYETSSPEQISYLLSDSGARVAIVESSHLDQLLEAGAGGGRLEHVIVVDGGGGTHTLEELERADPGFDPAPIASGLDLDDPLTLIYTSGTTGSPKGVLLTHGNLIESLVSVTEHTIDLPDRHGRVISWLPAAHIAERAANYYVPTIRGLEIHVCPDPKRIIEYLPKVRPSWFFAVPRIWEKLKAGLEAQLSAMPEERRGPAMAGLEAGIEKVRLQQAGDPVPEAVAAGVAEADEKLFAGLRETLGLDRVVAVSVGAAPISIEVLEFFHAIGIPIGELWGLSETCGVVTVNPPDRIKLGTVGPPVPGVEVKVADDGELLCRGPNVMAGYLNKPGQTAETIVDGWMHTGDIGSIDEDGYVSILDRKKELIINAAGKNMSPSNIEGAIKAATPLINQCVVIGDRRPYNVALIVLDPDYAPVWASRNGLEGVDFEQLAERERVVEAIEAGIEKANSRLARVEQIKRFTVLPGEWLPGGDELTPTMKLKRQPISEKYGERIEHLYGG